MKGISPLIAAVLLIAFTVAIATLIMGWFSSFTRSTTTSISNTTNQAVACSDARVSIMDVYINNGTQNANVIIGNIGGSPVSITGLEILNTTGNGFSAGFTKIGALNTSQIVTFTITGLGCGSCPTCFSKAVLTTGCGGVGDVFTNTPKCSTG